MSESNNRGSLWNRWDLHVHTPESLVHNYPGDRDEQWEAFLSDLERLPEDIRVLGISDYLFLDGYERILKEREAGRLSNVDLILPVVELRLNVFGGTDSRLSRVNFHVLFSDEIHAEVIREQFISGLARSFQLTPRYVGDGRVAGRWSGVITRQALDDLGSAIVETVPPEERV